jgi:tetratricopeptide (TPR) repeat protein
MSLLNQYLKTIGQEEAKQGHPEPLPSMLRVQQRADHKGLRGYKVTLSIIVPTLVIGFFAWQYVNQKSSKRAPSGLSQAGIAAVKEPPVKTSEVNTVRQNRLTPIAVSVSSAPVESLPEPELIPVTSAKTIHRQVDQISNAPVAGSESATKITRHAEVVPTIVSLSTHTEKIEPSTKEVPGDVEDAPQSSRQAARFKVPSQAAVTTVKKSESLPISKEMAQNYYQLGLVALQEGSLLDAEHYFYEMLKNAPNDISGLLNLSNVYIRQKRLNQAVDILERIRQLDSNNIKSLDNLGFIAIQQKDWEKAKGFFDDAMKLNPSDEIALGNLAYLAQIENNPSEAVQYYDRLISINPENVDALMNYAHLMSQGGDIDQAIRLYKQCLGLKSVQDDRELAKKIKHRINLMLGYN